MNIELSIGMPSNPRTWALLDGQVTPQGIDLVPSIIHPSELFWRQLPYPLLPMGGGECGSMIESYSFSGLRNFGWGGEG